MYWWCCCSEYIVTPSILVQPINTDCWYNKPKQALPRSDMEYFLEIKITERIITQNSFSDFMTVWNLVRIWMWFEDNFLNTVILLVIASYETQALIVVSMRITNLDKIGQEAFSLVRGVHVSGGQARNDKVKLYRSPLRLEELNRDTCTHITTPL